VFKIRIHTIVLVRNPSSKDSKDVKMQSAAISTSADDSFVRLLGQGHSHEPHNELASVVLSSSGIGVREIEYPTLRSPLTPLVDSSNLTVRPGADDIPQFLPHRPV